MRHTNSIKKLLISLGISSENSIRRYFPRTRDRKDVSVLRCARSGVILLSRTDHINLEHYRQRIFNNRGASTRSAALLATAEDTKRRASQFGNLIKNKKWLDVGTGAGGILDEFKLIARDIVAVEPQDLSRNNLMNLGYKAYPRLEDVRESNFNVVTLFHVLEHLPDPVNVLRLAKRKLKKGGKIIIEVPHAEDFLVSVAESKAFMANSFWSEHLMLHTKESLRIFLKTAGFSKIKIIGFQRYPLANHLYWLAKGKPGGHKEWQNLRSRKLDEAYASLLSDIGKTDTLIAIAEK